MTPTPWWSWPLRRPATAPGARAAKTIDDTTQLRATIARLIAERDRARDTFAADLAAANSDRKVAERVTAEVERQLDDIRHILDRDAHDVVRDDELLERVLVERARRYGNDITPTTPTTGGAG